MPAMDTHAEHSVEWNRLDARELAYHQRVEAGYRALIDLDPDRWQVFDARQPIDALSDQIADVVEEYILDIPTLGAAQ
jgi:dTMP kinase